MNRGTVVSAAATGSAPGGPGGAPAVAETGRGTGLPGGGGGKSVVASATALRAGRGRGFWLVAVLAAFVGVLALAMILEQSRRPRLEPWRSPELVQAKERLAKDPKNEALKAEIRERDRVLRVAYFRGLERNRSGAWLLLGAAVVLVGVAHGLARPVRPTESREAVSGGDRERTVALTRTTVLVTGGLVTVGLAALGWLAPVRLPAERVVAAADGRSAESPAAAPAAATASKEATMPDAESWVRNWPRFRGSDGSGIVGALNSTNLPLRWDLATGAGVVWRAEVALEGYSSPIVWEDRVYLTGGDKKSRLVFCFDAATGALVWQRAVTPTNVPPKLVQPSDQSGIAASTMATDGERAFAMFGSGELGALDRDGNLVWSKQLDVRDNVYGHAASLVVWRDRLIVQLDLAMPEDGKSSIQAFDTRTGAVAWSVKREVGGSWVTPIVVDVSGRPQLIAAGDPWLMAYDPAVGTEIWRAKVLGDELAPSPVWADGRVFVASPGRVLLALKTDGQGEVTDTHVAWKVEEEVPDVPTPVVVGDLLISASAEGKVIGREASTGRKLWEHEFEFGFQASPLAAGDRVYLFGQPGQVVVIRAGVTYEELANFEMGEDVFATPAVARDRFYLRTKQHLSAIGRPSSAPATGTP